MLGVAIFGMNDRTIVLLQRLVLIVMMRPIHAAMAMPKPSLHLIRATDPMPAVVMPIVRALQTAPAASLLQSSCPMQTLPAQLLHPVDPGRAPWMCMSIQQDLH